MIVFGIFVIIIMVIIFAISKERRSIIQYIDGPNGKKYKAQYSVKIERYKWWMDNYPKIRKNNF